MSDSLTPQGSGGALPRGVTRPIQGELLRLALPVLASQLLRLAYMWVDALWVARLGVNATAAVTTSAFVMWTVYSLHDIFGIGVAAYVSQLLGAGERARAGLAAFKGIRATATLGLAGTVVGLFAARDVYGLMGAGPGVLDAGGRYLAVVLAASPVVMMALTCETIMRASGDTRTPLFIDLASVSLNALLDPMLIYGIGPFPRLGVAGAAWATVIAQVVMLASYLTLAARGHEALPIATSAPGRSVRIAGMARVGLPAALIGMSFSIVYVAFARSAAAYGAAALAVVGIANRIEALQFVNSAAIGISGSTLVGQNLGARRPDRAVAVMRTGLTWGIGIAAVLTVVYLAFPGPFLRLFTGDPEALRLGVPYLRVLALCIVFNAAEIVVAESVMGSGHTTEVSWIFGTFSALRVPLGFLVPAWTGTGVVGIAWVITLTTAFRSVVILGWAARGTWKSGLEKELHGGAAVWTEPPEAA